MSEFGDVDRIFMSTDTDAWVIYDDIKSACAAVMKGHFLVDKFRVKVTWYQPFMRQMEFRRGAAKGPLKVTMKNRK